MLKIINPDGQSALHSIALTQTVLSLKQALKWDQVLIACGRKLQDAWILQQCIGPDLKVHLVRHKPADWVLLVKPQEGKVISVDIQSKASVQDLLSILETKGITNVKLVFQGQALGASLLLEAARVKHSSVLYAVAVRKNPVKVVISLQAKSSFTLDVELEHTLLMLKQQIKQKKQVETSAQRLFLGSNELKQDNSTLAALELANMSAIRLISKKKGELIVLIIAPRTVYHVQMPASSTIAQLKAEIQQLYDINRQLEMQLSKAGTIFKDTQTLKEAGISNRSKIDLKLLTSVLIRDLAGRLKRITLENEGTVQQLQAKITEKCSISAEKQRLKCQGEVLQPSQPIAQLFKPSSSSLSAFFLSNVSLQSVGGLQTQSAVFLDDFFP
jgi:hypothetical protein